MSTSNTILQQINPLTKSKLEKIDEHHIDSVQALSSPLNQIDVDNISIRRQSFDENKLSFDVLTIAAATSTPIPATTNTTKPILDRKKPMVYDINKLPTIQKQEETVMKKESLILSSLSSTKESLNTVNVNEKTPINHLKSVDNYGNAFTSHRHTQHQIDGNRNMHNQQLREEIKKIILKNNLACTCKIDKFKSKKDDKFVQYIRNQKKLLTDMKPKLSTMHKPDWKTWTTKLENADKKNLYKTTGI